MSYKSLLIIIVFLLIPIVFLLRLQAHPKTVSAEWFNDAWTYRQAITVTISSGSTDITNLDTVLSIGTSSLIASGKLQTDCDDLRFTNINGQLLPHYLDSSCNTSATKIWVQADLVPKNTTTYTLYVYYGNPSASSVSDPVTFNLYRGLVGYWNFNENIGTSTVDLSVNSNTGIFGTGSSAPSWTTGKYGIGTSFDGSNDYVDIGDIANVENQSQLTISSWVKFGSSVGDWEGIVSNGINISLLRGGSACGGTDDIFFRINTLGTNPYGCTTGNIISPGNWVNITAVFDGTQSTNADRLKIYFNGNQQTLTFSGTVGTSTPTNSSSLLIGKYGTSTTLSGVLDEVRIYNRALSSSEVSQLYSSPGSITSASPANSKPTTSFSTEEIGPGPIAHWKFDEGVGTTAYDSSGHNINGTFGTGSSAPTWASEDQCVSGKCLKFDGTDDYLTFGAPNLNITNNVTTSFWFKPLNSGGVVMYQGWNYVGNEYGWVVHYGTNHHQDTNTKSISWGSSNNSGNYNGSAVSQTDASSISTSSWQHITITKDNTLVSIYINGQLSKTEDISVAPITYNGGYNLYVGKQHANDYYYPHFNGFLDEIKIYPYARTATQIKEDYNAFAVNIGSAPQESKANSDGLVAYWKMDEGIGTTTLDSSGNGYTATLTGSTAPSWTTGKYGNGIDFDYAGYAEFTDIAFGTTSPWTASFWIYPNNNKNNIPLGRGTQSSYIRAYVNGASSSIAVRNTAAETESGVTVTMNTGTWYMVTATADGTGQAKMYLNGQYVGMSNPGASGTPITFDRFGTAYPGNINFSIDAKMDEIRIYNRTLSNSEVFDLYNYAPPPIAHWKFDEGIGTTAFDSSGNNLNAGWSGTGTHWTAGRVGKAASFNGTNDYLLLPSAARPMRSNTVSFWIKPDTWTNGSYPGIIGGYNFGGSDVKGGMGISMFNNTTLYYDLYDGTGARSIVGVPISNVPTNAWTHVSATWDGTTGTSALKMYINGVLKSTGSAATLDLLSLDWTTYPLFKIGNAYRNYYQGAVDDVKIYNYARTQKQIIEDMGSQNAPGGQTKLGSPIVHYKFDEGKGTTANNSGIGGTINGTFGTGSSAPTWTTTGKFGNALSFDGSNDYINVASGYTNTLKGDDDHTVSLWINGNSFANSPVIVSANTSQNYFFLETNNTGSQLLWGYGVGTSNYRTYNSNVTGGWHHIVMVKTATGDNGNLYLDGALQTSYTGSLGTVSNSSSDLLIGKYVTNGLAFNGSIDDFKIYNYALTADEIKQDYNRGSSFVAGSTNQTIGGTTTSLDYCISGDTSTCSPPIAEWKMDEGVGTTAYDTTGNKNNASFTNSPSWNTGKIGKAINFNGSNNYLSIGTSLSINLDNVFTVEAWINPNISRRQMIFSNAYSGTSFNFGMSGNNLELFYPGVYVAGTGCSLPLNTWTHVTVVRSGTQNTKFYRNGSILTGGYDNNYTFSNAVSEKAIGRSSGGSTYFSGLIDQVRIYNYARTPAQVAYDYNRGGPVGWWKLDECEGSVAHDSAAPLGGVGNTGAIVIGASGTQNSLGTCSVGTSAAWTNGSTGKWNSSLNFDGTDDYIEMVDTTNSTYDISGDLTISAWFKRTGPSAGAYPEYSVIAAKHGLNGTSSDSYMIRYLDGKLAFTLRTAGNDELLSNAIINSNQWYHGVGVFNSTTNSMKIYINGNLDNTGSSTGTAIATNNTNFRIGSSAHASAIERFNGQIDDVRVYNYALTAEQIRQLYNGGAVNFR